MTTKTYKFETPNDYIIADIDGQCCLIDTGCPFTVGNKPFSFMGKEVPTFTEIPMMPGRDADSLGRDIGVPLTHLVGLDVLGQHPFVIDWDRKTLEFHLDNPELGGEIVPISNGLGLRMNFKADGVVRSGMIDTGAPLWFAPRGQTKGEPKDVLHDFFPQGGRFTSDVYHSEIEVGSRKFPARVSVFPGMQGEILSGVIGWLAGADLWKAGPVGFDVRRGRLHLFSRN